MKLLFITPLMLLAAITLPLLADETKATKPKIIIILTDNLGWADLGAQGIRKDIRTPNLDALAHGGLSATSGYITAPQCVPSRAGLLTGRSQSRFGVESNSDTFKGFDAQDTVASRLKKAGYATGITGKWHLGAAHQITMHGFDDVYFNQGKDEKAWEESADFYLDGKPAPKETVFNTNKAKKTTKTPTHEIF